MTHPFQRTALILLATSAIGLVPPAADAARHHHRKAPAGPPATYVVKPGDSLDRIAKTLGVTIPELKAANGLKSTTIQPGDTLKNPKAEPKEPPASKSRRGKAGARIKADMESAPAQPQDYKVRKGDTLFSISKKLGVSMDDLRSANGLSRKAQIHAGQTLKLPGAEPAAAAEAAPEVVNRHGRKARAGAVAPAGGGDYAASGRVITVEGRAGAYRVRKGDTLAKIADKLDTTVAQLKRDNHIRGSSISPGRTLKGPRTSAKAYVAGSGDTLAGVAERFGVSVAALRRENGLSRRAGVRPGQTLRLPEGYRDRGRGQAMPERAPTPTPTYEPPPRYSRPEPSEGAGPARPQPDTTGLPSRPQPYSGTPSTSFSGAPPTAAPTAAPPPTDAQISALGRGRFQWPIRGDILSDFGPKAAGQRNDGVNIQAGAGDPVRAAADGDVVYAGDQVPGFGNLVLVKHADGWVTAYGHLSKVEVKMQQKVQQGQEIGQVGSTGGVPEPQLHFEVRYAPSPSERARPIDPKLVLPR